MTNPKECQKCHGTGTIITDMSPDGNTEHLNPCPTCQTTKPTDGGWEEKFDREFNKHGFCNADCSDFMLTGIHGKTVKDFIRQTVSAAVLAERQRCVEAVESIKCQNKKEHDDCSVELTKQVAIEAINGKGL